MNDNDLPSENNIGRFDLNPGLLDYYSSQTELMLAQYDNINRLLGPTHDWTHPGDLCEVLIRDFLRKFLPSNWSVDKGYIYGRSTIGGKDTHCPEIDILIHDTQPYRPLFRMGDFVIVQPQAVRGIIQVKRTFSRNEVESGMENVVQAKQHLISVLMADKSFVKKEWPPKVPSAVIGFQEGEGDQKINRKSAFFRKRMLSFHQKYRLPDTVQSFQGAPYFTISVLPTFVGSLNGFFLNSSRQFHYNEEFNVHESVYLDRYIFAQAILASLMFTLQRKYAGEMPPMAFPPGWQPFDHFWVLKIVSANVDIQSGTLKLRRNDDFEIAYRKVDGSWQNNVGIIIDSSGKMAIDPRIQDNVIGPKDLYVQVDSGNSTEGLILRFVRED